MPLCRAIAVSALIWSATNHCNGVDAFAPPNLQRSHHAVVSGATEYRPLRQYRSALHMSTRSPPGDINFYKVLGVEKGASVGDIKAAYRKLAKVYHPDVNKEKDTTEQFQTLNRAYEVLSDSTLRKNYDMFGGRGVGTSAASDRDAGEAAKQRARRVQDMTNFWAQEEFYGGFAGGGHPGYDPGFDPFDGGSMWDDHPPMDDMFGSRWETVGVGGVGVGVKVDANGYSTRTPNNRRKAGVKGSAGSAKATGGGNASANRQRRTPHVSKDSGFDFFGSSGKKNGENHRPYGPIVGNDIAMDFHVDFKTAILGGKVEVAVSRFEECGTCNGNGARPGTKKTTCEKCQGSGISIPVNSRSGPVYSIACPNCKGTGEKIPHACGICKGSAINQKTTTVTVDIPAGVSNGNKVRIAGEGDVGPNAGPPGDLFLFLKVKEDPIFRREGSDIFIDTTITCVDAIIGTEITVPVIDGEATIEIPPGTQPGDVICVKNRGAPSLIAKERGDHFVTVNIKIPNGKEDMENRLVQLLNGKDSSTSSSKNSTGTAKSEMPKTKNASVSFPKTVGAKATAATTTTSKGTVNASVPFPTSSTVTSPADSNSKTSTTIDKKTLESLYDQAAKADEEKKERLKFEELAKSREKELEQQAKKLKELEMKAAKDREQRSHFEKLASEREQALKDSARRQLEMNKDITIRVRQNQGQTTRITIKKSMEMSRLFDLIARQKGLRAADMKFTYKGKAVLPKSTPMDMDMDSNALIDALVHRRAGGGVGAGVRFK